jgi:hypothetical protein
MSTPDQLLRTALRTEAVRLALEGGRIDEAVEAPAAVNEPTVGHNGAEDDSSTTRTPTVKRPWGAIVFGWVNLEFPQLGSGRTAVRT